MVGGVAMTFIECIPHLLAGARVTLKRKGLHNRWWMSFEGDALVSYFDEQRIGRVTLTREDLTCSDLEVMS